MERERSGAAEELMNLVGRETASQRMRFDRGGYEMRGIKERSMGKSWGR
jgi:hypothetical protein